MLDQLQQTDTDLLLFINGHHAAFADYMMMLYSSRWVWVPLYVSFLYVMFRNYPPRTVLRALCAIALIIVLCDQTASSLLKPWVERLRPANEDNPISPMVHVVNGYRGGRYGFPSSHAANAWGLAFFAMWMARRRALALWLTAWSLVMVYSRAYLGVHYPGDLLAGTALALLFSSLVYWALRRLFPDDALLWQNTARPLRHARLPLWVALVTLAGMGIAAAVMMETGCTAYVK